MKRKHLWRIGAAVIAAALILLLAFTGALPWSPLNCWHEEIDIRSARVRYSRVFLFVRVSKRIADTPASQALLPGDFQANAPVWRKVNTFSPGLRYSPHYSYHGAIYQLKQLEKFWEFREFTPAARRESVLRLLSAWQRDRRDNEGHRYVIALMEMAHARSADGPRPPIDVPDLPASEAKAR